MYRAGGPQLYDIVVHVQAPHMEAKAAFCGDPTGWHSFRRYLGTGSVDYHICARHWRVAMGYPGE